MKIVFFFSLFIIFYIYIGYPLLIYLLSLLKNSKITKDIYEPSVSLIIPAYNEENYIANSIQNKLDLNYPKDKLEIIVVSDGSTDRTEEIVTKFEKDGIKLIKQNPRAGKTQALNRAVNLAKGEIIVFSDANSLYHPNALKMIIRNFYDPSVGYVTGQMKYTNPDGNAVGDGCTAYMKYEYFLRERETLTGSIVGADGGIDAVRKHLYKPMNQDQLPDLVLPLQVVLQGFRVIYEPQAISEEAALTNFEDEYRMRVRVSLRAFWAISDLKSLLSIRKYGLFAIQIWSHKVLRYLAFIFFLFLYTTNYFLYNNHPFYKAFFILQNSFYLISIIIFIIEKSGIKVSKLNFTLYFALINVAAGHAFVKFLQGKRQILWNPRKGS